MKIWEKIKLILAKKQFSNCNLFSNSSENDKKNNDSKNTNAKNKNSNLNNSERTKKRTKTAIITAFSLLIFGGLVFWIIASTWIPPVIYPKYVQADSKDPTNSLIFYDDTNKERPIAKINNKNRFALYSKSSSGINDTVILAVNHGMFSGFSISAYISQITITVSTSTPNQLSRIENKSNNTSTDYTIKTLVLADRQYLISPSYSFYLTSDQVNQNLTVEEIESLKKTNVDFLSKSMHALYSSKQLMPIPFNPLNLIISLLPLLLLLLLFYLSFKRMGDGVGGSGGNSVFSIGKSQAKLANSNIKFSDVAGIQEEKYELEEIVDYLKKPQKYVSMGARVPRGIILYGPPGTGKTLLAKAVAGEANVPFFQVSGSAFEDMLVGVGAKRVRDLFQKAAKAAPAIIFIDEIDSVASKRGKLDLSGAGLADQTINQLLAEMDGFSPNTGVIVIAATNRLDVLDPAILRPGRFDRQIQINLPDIKERIEILKIHSKNKNISSTINFDEIARKTPGFSGAQLENVLNEATLLAVRENKTIITAKIIDEAIDRVIAGPAKQTRVITKAEKEQIAYHEAGHALVGLHIKGADVVEKITIIPRGRAAGYTISVPEKQELSIQRKQDLLAIVASTLGGRACEEIVYGVNNISTGAANDLYKVTSIVRAMVTQYGMSSLGMTQFIPSEGQVNPYQNNYSEETALLIDEEINKIINEQYLIAKKIINENKEELKLIVDTLLILETISKQQIDYIHNNLKMPKEAIETKEKLEKEFKEKNKS